MSKLERVSKPGCRVYVKGTAVPSVLGGMGINIISTSRGVMTDRRARRDKVGGELLCRVY
jgi:small subunit ribosomal protein S8